MSSRRATEQDVLHGPDRGTLHAESVRSVQDMHEPLTNVDRDAPSRQPAKKAWLLEVRLLRQLLQWIGNPPLTIVLWSGEEVSTSDAPPVARILIRSRAAFWRLLRNPTIAFGDGYCDRSIEIEGDLVECQLAIFRHLRNSRSTRGFARWFVKLYARPRRHSVSESRDCVHAHYDIGNSFYQLWLDERMVYTCAYFAEPSFTLEQAQVAKLDHVCRKLQLAPQQTVVEAGCGWGALALHMAQKYGVKVRAFNISQEQLAYAREQCRRAGLEQRVEFIEDDYRNITGRYDAFVSVGMLEHVGPENYVALGAVLDRVLEPEGRGLIHSIGRNAPQPIDAWTEKRIFPRAYPPSLREIVGLFEPYNFSVLDVENLRLHYARTIEHWLLRYDNAYAAVASMFDAQFARTWRFYLASAAAAFLNGDLQLFQVVVARGTNQDVPWTRRHLYADVPGA